MRRRYLATRRQGRGPRACRATDRHSPLASCRSAHPNPRRQSFAPDAKASPPVPRRQPSGPCLASRERRGFVGRFQPMSNPKLALAPCRGSGRLQAAAVRRHHRHRPPRTKRVGTAWLSAKGRRPLQNRGQRRHSSPHGRLGSWRGDGHAGREYPEKSGTRYRGGQRGSSRPIAAM
jgi:hypothetical protein